MIPAGFEYVVAEHPDHAIDLLAKREDAKLLAGGHSLIPAMKLRIARPALLVDVGRIGDLSYIREDGDTVAIGALTRHKDVASAPVLRQHCPIVSHTAGQVGDPQVRHRGTIGGSIAHGDPASDLPSVILALDGELVARGPGGERAIPARHFFTGVFQTDLAPDEMLVEIRVPKLGSAGWSYTKLGRRAQDWATVAVAAVCAETAPSSARRSRSRTWVRPRFGRRPRRLPWSAEPRSRTRPRSRRRAPNLRRIRRRVRISVATSRVSSRVAHWRKPARASDGQAEAAARAASVEPPS